MLKDFISSHHKSTSRNYFERMNPDKKECMKIAAQFEKEYWDGDRKYGYGGYRYDGRWAPLADRLIKEYELTNESKVLDLGCGKAFILFELQKKLPGISLVGRDISKHALKDTPGELTADLEILDLNQRDCLSHFQDNFFDLTLSIMTLHNLELPELESSLKEIERISKRSFVAVESYRNWSELTNLQCWALTCNSFLSPREWEFLFEKTEYSGDFEFLFFT
ncbi:MAG: SAM-dependent methyltransferase [Halobacteriovorax sp.]|nr:SAM-dependent methyltransferase [Halobacteriovorax sp.]|tara:strand:+ start:82133 stop:82798 length:666 start_codon:yes stop_codon:yes gene_type:complete